ncbi:hypothetical protein BJY00DRAFT_72320 [Aspergillus carlsbadensis]|nr:hypothetical protein BJY00DRAFT_72320 [Aspergillus carlsbadensis]
MSALDRVLTVPPPQQTLHRERPLGKLPPICCHAEEYIAHTRHGKDTIQGTPRPTGRRLILISTAISLLIGTPRGVGLQQRTSKIELQTWFACQAGSAGLRGWHVLRGRQGHECAVKRVFREMALKVARNDLVDAVQGGEAPLVLYCVTGPGGKAQPWLHPRPRPGQCRSYPFPTSASRVQKLKDMDSKHYQIDVCQLPREACQL